MILGCTQEIFLVIYDLEQGSPPRLVKKIVWLVVIRRRKIQLRNLILMLRDNALLTTRFPALLFDSNHFSRPWFFGAITPRIWIYIHTYICTYIHTRTHARTCTRAHAHTCTGAHAYTCAHGHTRTRAQAHTHTPYTHTDIYTVHIH